MIRDTKEQVEAFDCYLVETSELYSRPRIHKAHGYDEAEWDAFQYGWNAALNSLKNKTVTPASDKYSDIISDGGFDPRNEPNTPKSADGVKCSLLFSGKDYFIRVYNKDHSFRDYEILHNDLSFVIKDKDAFFYEKEGKMYLDHSPETLGIKG